MLWIYIFTENPITFKMKINSIMLALYQWVHVVKFQTEKKAKVSFHTFILSIQQPSWEVITVEFVSFSDFFIHLHTHTYIFFADRMLMPLYCKYYSTYLLLSVSYSLWHLSISVYMIYLIPFSLCTVFHCINVHVDYSINYMLINISVVFNS